ncbi:hypothetical protein HZB06_02635 [Candidatus Wolfebacteria bacterium]|nr:hypothetical protein [Candidatus Wolfebacteria bacterium]
MEEKLLKILKEARQIQPNSDYSRNSKMLILTSNKSVPAQTAGFNIFNKFIFNKLSVSSATVAIISVILIAGYYFNSIKNENEVIARANEINASIQVRLTEIQYLLSHKTDTANATIDDIQILLTEATANLEEAEKLVAENKTEEAFDKIKRAQEIFSEIDALIRQ